MKPRIARRAVALCGLVCLMSVVSGLRLRGAREDAALWRTEVAAQNQEPTVRSCQIAASRYKFDPSRIEIFQDDLVKVELRTEDIAHSLTIDTYRIAKRVSPGHPITFEFRADQPGTFAYYCNLQIDDGCRQMRGELVVKPRRQ